MSLDVGKPLHGEAPSLPRSAPAGIWDCSLLVGSVGGPGGSQALGISVVKQRGNQAHFLAFLLREELSGQVLRNQGRALNLASQGWRETESISSLRAGVGCTLGYRIRPGLFRA